MMNKANASYGANSDVALIDGLRNVSELLDDAASRDSGTPLLNFFEDALALTASELRDKSLRLATLLRSYGIGVGTVVGVALPNQPSFPVAWMALLRLGAVMVPLNTRYTSDEFKFVLGDANATFALVDEQFEPALRAGVAGLVADDRVLVFRGLDTDRIWLGAAAQDLPAEPDTRWPDVKSLDVAGIHYTSGTTGFPKGCVLTHRYWLVMGAASKLIFPTVPTRVLTDAPFFYLDAPSELILSLAFGAQQFVARRASLSKFTGWLANLDIDYAEVWEALAEKVVDPQAEARLRNRSQKLTGTSFALKGGHQRALQDRLNATIREQFGMTEVGLAMYQPWGDDECVGSGSCGVVAPFRETRIVDPESGQDVPDGCTGELWIRGDGVMLRYHNRFEVNATVFQPGGWFRTGDLVYRDDRGHHYIKGRIKDMIRRSHENIAAAEVEAALKAVEGIEAAGVVAVPDSFRGEEVKAFIVLAPGNTPATVTPQSIRVHALRHLASFKVPRYYEFVEQLPMTPSGKVSKHQLKALDEGGPYGWDADNNAWKERPPVAA